MAHIFKHPENGNKGIICFTHKEARFFYSNHPYFKAPEGRVKRLLPSISKAQNQSLHSRFKDHFNQIRKKYFVGIHFGWHHESFPTLTGIDFYLGGPGTVSFAEPKEVRFIPLDGSSFIPSCFYLDSPKAHSKEWDIIMVSRDVKWKNLDRFLQSVRKLYDEGNMYDILLIVPSNSDLERDQNPRITYTNLLSDYERMFSYEERGKFSILKTHHKMPFLALAQPQIAKFYHLSKVFTLFSENEGGSRVISEALLAGLPVVVKSNLSGGGRDFLNDSNSIMFEDFDKAHITLKQAVENWEVLNTDQAYVKKNAHEEDSLRKLKDYFSSLYQDHRLTFDGNLINEDWLSFRINGHWHAGLPWAQDGSKDADITTFAQWNTLLKSLYL